MNTQGDPAEKSMAADEAVSPASHYTPRHAKRKFGMAILGLFVLAYGWSELWPPLSLVLAGHQAWGEATRVIKTKPGLPDQILTDDLEVNAAEETHDRSYIFWNEFKFTTADNQQHIVRFAIGSQLKPLFPLLDEDGLPTTVRIYYDPNDAGKICIPIVFSTWFAPGLITFMGVICFLCGCMILYHAHDKIELT